MTEPAALLRQNGIPITAQRLAVLKAVSDRPHGTVDAIAENVRANIGAISQQAVYDALGMLVKKGLIRRIQPAGSPAALRQGAAPTAQSTSSVFPQVRQIK